MNKSRILVTGGAGYIGSHTVKALIEKGNSSIVVLDNLSTGFADTVSNALFIEGDIRNEVLLNQLFSEYSFDTVLHFAACTVIPESFRNPLKYYDNNTVGTIKLFNACHQYQVKHFIFSSTAAVYEVQAHQNLTENAPLNPTNPYGRSKWMSEEFIKEVATLHNIRYAILRYFNVAGATPCGQLGQKTLNASHLIKVAVETACNQREQLPIYGTDYPTHDGTCIRDFIHVCDLANAHLFALDYLHRGGNSCVLNCGYGKGYSVKEVIEALEAVSGKKLPVKEAPRREGDLPRVVADNTRLTEILGWKPEFDDLELIVKSAYEYQKKLII